MIWALHPIQINAVTYIVQRMTSLAVLFSLISMTAWLAGRKRWIKKFRIQAVIFWIIGFISWCLGLLSKEHVAIVPLLILIHEFFLFRRGEFFRVRWRWILMTVVPIAALTLFYLGSEPMQRILAGYARRDFTLTERLMTESRVLWHYASLFFIPVAERFSIFYDYPVSKSIFLPLTTLISFSAWAGLVFSAIVYRKRFPVFAWATAWFLAAHLIESTFIPLEIIFEHRMYLPSISLALGLVLIVFDFMRKRIHRQSIRALILVTFLLILSTATYIRNMDFKDEVSLYQAELYKFPNSNRNRLGLALALNSAGRFEKGGNMLREMAEASPYDFVLQQNWYNFLVRIRNDHSGSEEVYRKILQIIERGDYDPHHDAMALKNLAELLFEKGNYQRALFMVDRLLMNHRKGSFFLLKGICLAKLDEWLSAKQAFYDAWRRDPQDINMVYWYGKSLIHSGEKDKGCLFLTEGVQTARGDKKVRILSQKVLDMHCHETN